MMTWEDFYRLEKSNCSKCGCPAEIKVYGHHLQGIICSKCSNNIGKKYSTYFMTKEKQSKVFKKCLKQWEDLNKTEPFVVVFFGKGETIKLSGEKMKKVMDIIKPDGVEVSETYTKENVDIDADTICDQCGNIVGRGEAVVLGNKICCTNKCAMRLVGIL